jgi:endoglucanase
MAAATNPGRLAACLAALVVCAVTIVSPSAAQTTRRDRKPPTTPTNLHSTGATTASASIAWNASTYNVGVAGYDVYRGTTRVATTTATSSTLTGLTCGSTLSVGVIAFDAAGNRSSKTSANASTSACAATAPSSTGAPSVSGTAQVGQTLTTSDGFWSGTTPMTYAYQWLSCDSSGANCATIAGATAKTYLLAAADQGHAVRARVTASNGAGSASAQSAQTGAVQPGTTPAPASGLHVSGNQLLDASNNVVHLHGVNYSGPEYACIQGWGIFDGPSDAASVQAMKAWNVNTVRVPLNEDCWLGINGMPSAYAGANYRNAIVSYVNLLHQYGMYAEVSLIWGAPGTYKATYQPGAPDEDHSPAFWSSLATTFKNDSNVILAPWGETVVNADCFLNGGVCEATYGSGNTAYNTAGMQQAVNVMRQAGYTGVISIPGIDYANDLTQWLSHEPNDPQHQLIAEAHVYGKNTCSSTTCLTNQMGPVAAQVPLIFGETGETWDDSDCGSTYISAIMGWADSHGVGYQAWTWDTWGTCGSLISDFSGTAANGYGSWVKTHYGSFQ